MKSRRVISAVVVAFTGFVVSAQFVLAQCPAGTGVSNGQTACVAYIGPQYYNTKGAPYTFGSKPMGPYSGFIETGSPSSPNVNAETFVSDDFVDKTPSLFGSWSTTTYNAAYLAENWSTVGSTTKYGSSIGIVGYAQIANLVVAMLNNNPSSVQPAGATVDGVNVSGTSQATLEVALSEAIYFLTNGKTTTSGGVTTYYIGSTKLGTSTGGVSTTLAISLINAVKGLIGNSTQAASALESRTDSQVWVFVPGSGTNPEFWGLFPTAVPEGGVLLAYLLVAFSAFLVSVVVARRTPQMPAVR